MSSKAFSHLEICEKHEELDCARCAAADAGAIPRILTPHMGMADDEVETTEFFYSDRAPEDWVVSGPLGENGHGNGRSFATIGEAEKWARGFYGWRFKGRLPDEGFGGRWAMLVRGPRGLTNGD
jgi:hypothetical protein